MTDGGGVSPVRQRQAISIGLALAFAALSAVLLVKGIARQAVAPESWDFESFSRHHQPMQLRRVRVAGKDYFVWLEQTSATAVLLRAGSGAPLYVFDSAGTLVGWSPTTGDREYEVFLGQPWAEGEALSVDEVRRRLHDGPTMPHPPR